MIGHRARRCSARKSAPDIETNVGPILWGYCRARVIDGPRYSISAKVHGEESRHAWPSPALSADYPDATYSPIAVFFLSKPERERERERERTRTLAFPHPAHIPDRDT